jgi:hypothetical protein
MLRRIRNWIQRRQKTPDERRDIRLFDFGFCLNEGELEVGCLQWSSVDQIIAYKTDDFTSDTVRLEFRNYQEGPVFFVSEDNAGFWALVSEIKRIFPTSDQIWEKAVIQPPFEDNRTEIFRRSPL